MAQGLTLWGFIFVSGALLAVTEAGTSCLTSDDCSRNQCCVSDGGLRGRRSVRTKRQLTSRAGSCQDLGSSGDRCYVSPPLSADGNAYVQCPCRNGFSCQGTGLIEIPYGEVGSCVESSGPLPCNKLLDCPKGYCCVSNVRPIGKRSTDSSIGHCQPRGTQASRCLVRNVFLNPTGTVFDSCPCSPGYRCVGSGQFDIPLGEIGRCSSYWKTRGGR